MKPTYAYREPSFKFTSGRLMHPENQRSSHFFSSGFANENPPWFGAPKPNAAGVIPVCPCPIVVKSNGEATSPPVDIEGVTGVNTNWGGLGPVVSFAVVVPGVFGGLKENIGLSVAGAGADDVVVVAVENALTGIVGIPNTVPFLSGLGPGLGVSCLGVASEKTPGEVPVVTGVVEFVDGKATFESVPPTGLFAAKLNSC